MKGPAYVARGALVDLLAEPDSLERMEALFERWGPLSSLWKAVNPDHDLPFSIVLYEATVGARQAEGPPQVAPFEFWKSCGVDLNERTARVSPLIHHAVRSAGAVADVRALLSAGADPNVVNGFGKTPLQALAHHDWGAPAVRLRWALLDHGASLRWNDRPSKAPSAALLLTYWIERAVQQPEVDRDLVDDTEWIARGLSGRSGAAGLLELVATSDHALAWNDIDPRTGQSPIDRLRSPDAIAVLPHVLAALERQGLSTATPWPRSTAPDRGRRL